MNIIAVVLIAAIAAFALGFLWHGPLFGKTWIRLMKIPQSDIDAMQAKGMGPMLPQMFGAVVQQIVVATVIAHLAYGLGVYDPIGAVLFGFILWLGFIATVQLNGVLWENKSWSLYAFNVTYHLVSMVLVSVIVVWLM